MKFRFTIIILLISSFLAVDASIGKVYDVDFAGGKTLYVYSGVKSTLRINGLPSDIDSVQLSVVRKPSAPKAVLLGKRNKRAGGSINSLDYVIEIEHVPFGKPIKQLVEVQLKTFKKSGERSYDVVDRKSYYIRPLSCSGELDEVCAIIKTKCRTGNPRCVEDEMKLCTYRNDCERKKHGGEFLHDGACAETTI